MIRFVVTCVLVMLAVWFPQQGHAAGKSVHVRGYTRKNGTYVAPHTRSAPRTGYRGLSPSIPVFVPPPRVPRDVPVDGYTKDDGTYVAPHMRHIDGIKDPERVGSSRHASSLRSGSHRTKYRETARALASAPKSKMRYPSREWKSSDGKVVARGRMQWQAMNKLRIALDDGTVADLLVEELSDNDQDWLEAAKRDPQAMKIEVETPDDGKSPAAVNREEPAASE